MTIRVLIVDDSAVVRQILTRSLSQDPDIEVVGAAPDPFVARDMIVSLEPDVLTLDVEMPRMDGITFLRKLMQYHPIPTLILSSLTPEGSVLALAAFAAGAIDVIAKPRGAYTLAEASQEIIAKVKVAATARLQAHCDEGGQVAAPLAFGTATHKLLAVGASTGGTRALEHLFARMPPDGPATAIVQHMPEQFTKGFADRLNEISPMTIKEAEDGEIIGPGHAVLARGNHHLIVTRSGANYRAELRSGPAVCHSRPSVDVLFSSVAKAAGKNAVGVILTGMGSDGARGMLKMKEAGAPTLAQDEKSCVVFGMPRSAIELGAVVEVAPLEEMHSRIVRALRQTE